MTNSVQAWQKRMAFHGALMLWITMIYGLYLVGVMTELVPGDDAMTLGAHINGLMGAFWLLGMGWSLSFIQLSERLLSVAFALDRHADPQRVVVLVALRDRSALETLACLSCYPLPESVWQRPTPLTRFDW